MLSKLQGSPSTLVLQPSTTLAEFCTVANHES